MGVYSAGKGMSCAQHNIICFEVICFGSNTHLLLHQGHTAFKMQARDEKHRGEWTDIAKCSISPAMQLVKNNGNDTHKFVTYHVCSHCLRLLSTYINIKRRFPIWWCTPVHVHTIPPNWETSRARMISA